MSSSRPVLAVYKDLLRLLRIWPSVKRDKVTQEIRLEFRQNASEQSADKRKKMLEEAEAGLRSLRQQCGLSEGTDVNFMADAELQRANRR